MRVFARSNHIGWIHLWRSAEAYTNGEPSEHFFNGRTDPRWQELTLSEAQQATLAAGELLELDDPGYLEEED